MSLITHIDQIKGASTINVNTKLDEWQPYIDEAELTFIKPVLGADLFKKLDDEANASGSGPSDYDTVLDLIQRALGLYALYLGIDEKVVSVTAAGLQVIQSETHRPAPNFLILNLKETYNARANRYVDLALTYIEENKSLFPEYQALDGTLFIHNAAELQQYVDIRGSRRVFMAMKPVMRTIERRYIRPTVSPLFFDYLKDLLSSSGSEPYDDADQAILDLIRPAVAHLTIARALEEISLDILDWGAFDTAGNTFDNVRGKQAANQEKIGIMITANQKDGDAALRELQAYLDQNATSTVYPLYFNSDRYAGPLKTRNEFTNNADNSIFVV